MVHCIYIPRGQRLKFPNKILFFALGNSVNPDEMPHYNAAFHLGSSLFAKVRTHLGVTIVYKGLNLLSDGFGKGFCWI